MQTNYDVVVIGAGVAGYVAAIRCAQLGMSVVCLDKWLDKDANPRLGGTCLNVGCIPSKAMLESSHHYEFIQHEADEHGIEVTKFTSNIDKMLARKNAIVNDLTDGVNLLFGANKIQWLQGVGQLLPNLQVQFTEHNKKTAINLQAKHVILATGSVPAEMPQAPFDHKLICDSEDALSWKKVPKRLGVIGAGVIALEMGSVWNRLGSEVKLFHPSSTFLRNADSAVSRTAKKVFLKQGLQINSGHKVVSVEKAKATVKLVVQDVSGKKQNHTFDKLLIATGRVPVSVDVAHADVGLSVDEKGRIVVDENCRTNIQNVWAIGDAVRGDMLAHKGSEEGVVVAERINGEKPFLDYNAVPYVIYTFPEIAWVGFTEKQLKDKGIPCKTGSFGLTANGRAKSIGKSAVGTCKLIAHGETDSILGMHIISPQASELIAIGVQAIETESSSEDLARTMFAHPTLSEVVHEASLGVLDRTLHAIK